MKLKDVIDNLDKRESNKNYVCYQDLAEQVNVDLFWTNTDKEEDSDTITCYWINPWYDGDTWIGYMAYFFQDELVCISHESSRKSGDDFYWVDVESYNKIRDYFISLQNPKPLDIEFLNLEEDMGEGYPLRYTDQLLQHHTECDVIYVPTNEKARVLPNNITQQIGIKEVNIKMVKTGEVKTTPLSNILFPWVKGGTDAN